MTAWSPDPFSRRKLLLLTGGAGAFVVGCGDDEPMDPPEGSDEQETQGTAGDIDAERDLAIVNYALTLEHLEAGFYEKVIASGLFAGDELALLREFGAHEAEHVDALTAAAKELGDPAEDPGGEFPLQSREQVLELARDVEDLGAAAYLGQAAAISDRKLLAAALSIHTVEARHAAVLNVLNGDSPTPDVAFAVPADMGDVLEEVERFLPA